MKKLIWIVVIAALTAVAALGVPKKIVEHMHIAESYDMTGAEAIQVMHAKVQAVEALRNYQTTLVAIRAAHKWPDDVVFDDKSDSWVKKPAEQPDAKK